MSAGFSITFSGQFLDGFDHGLVKARFGERFGISGAKLEKVFSARRVILKKGLDEAQASALRRELNAIGVLVDTRDASGTVVVLPEAAPDTEAPVGLVEKAVDPIYRIVYAGALLPGFARERVVAGAARRLKLGERQLKAVFSGREIGLKQGLNLNEVRRYLEVLRDLGMDVRCDPPLPQVRDNGSVGPAGEGSESTAVEQDLMKTVIWSDPVVQDQSADTEEDRLIAALRADFDMLQGNSPAAAMQPATTGEVAATLGQGEEHLAQTMLNPDALRAYFEPEPDHPEADSEIVFPAPVPEAMIAVQPEQPSEPASSPGHRDEIPDPLPQDLERVEEPDRPEAHVADMVAAAPNMAMSLTDGGVDSIVAEQEKPGPARMHHTTAILLGVISALVVVLVIVVMS